MKQPSDIKIAAAIVLDKNATEETRLRVHEFYLELSRYFHAESFCFFHHDDDAIRARRTLLKAAALEDYHQTFTYLLWVRGIDKASLSTLRQMVNVAESCDAGNAIIVAPFDAILADAAAIRDLVCKHAEESWFTATDDHASPEEALCLNLKTLGYRVQSISLTTDGNDDYIRPFKFSAGVQYLPGFHLREARTITVHTEMAIITKTAALLRDSLRKKAIAIYGAGTVATSLLPVLGETVKLVVDKNLAGKQFMGRTIAHPNALKDYTRDIDSILITPLGREAEIRKYIGQLLGDQYDDGKVIGFDSYRDSANGNAKKTTVLDSTDTEALPSTAPFIRPATNLTKTRQRSITKRGVLYVGYLCNVRCVFCYYAYTPAKDWHTIEECKKDAHQYRTLYDNDWVDITGGEPTVYPHIFELLDYCKEIGLTPTLITNMQALAKKDKALKFKEYGVYDFLCSIHALGDTYDDLTKVKGSWKNVMTALENLHAIDMKWRANCTMTAVNRHQLRTIAELVYNAGGRVINFINYNPFGEWSTKMDIDFQSRHFEITPYLKEALDYCDEVGLEANVRYLPFCIMKGHENKCYNYPQLSYDSHEWDYCSWFCMDTRNIAYHVPEHIRSIFKSEAEYHLYVANKVKRDGFCQSDRCMFCAAGFICDGFTTQYASRFGTDEMQPYPGKIITDPTWFIRNQDKVVDE
ncbi:MAG: radical SAM protein [Magnetococcales bacterium]|uniref:Radical SAM protein n=1 Tax=Candidatus Magnetobacterium casense TaxID=1455061 RepID=A0ABS6S1N3_9BACT|nr:radical SAM protein [Candidatus Magnetobacterium casensis]MBF0609423.1 radical SAM protein [Nitrospirota bacterium]MBV6342726.1 radical SAM protein [Candidatus Magnetobacterium casensis]